MVGAGGSVIFVPSSFPLKLPSLDNLKLRKSLLRGKHAGIAFNAHFIADGVIVYRQACALGCEGIVSKRLGSAYRGGRADCWIKVKNPAAPAVTREAEEEWN